MDIADLEALKARLVQDKVEAVGVCFLHSFTNPAHEQMAATGLQTQLPEISVSISSEVAPEIREY